ncbi:hypothetical protein ACH4GK_17710 [Streptomyces rimosus]|uniref:hypothetical protein n=1 Tax=Streptomyces rimosus TaxID=1927 RepID=UPI0004C51AA2|nr:hypothetical protein [Streptomyces rimosus]
MSALDQLFVEELPTGTFGDAQPPKPRTAPRPRRPWLPAEQAAHYAALAAAIGERHLTALPAHDDRSAA